MDVWVISENLFILVMLLDKEVRFKGSSVKGVLDEEKANELWKNGKKPFSL